jgi:hypothetical protein
MQRECANHAVPTAVLDVALAEGGLASPTKPCGLERNYGPTTDHHGRTQRNQRSTVDASEQWFTLDNRHGPIWGSRGREFKSREPEE